MITLLGEYLNKLKVNKTKVGKLSDIKRPRINDLCNKVSTKLLPEEFYKIIMTSILLKKLPEEEFNISLDEIFPDRPKANFLNEVDHLSPEIQFIKKHCLKQKEVEEKIGMSEGKISRLGSEDVKEVLAVELICFIEGLGLDVLKNFKEIYGEVNIDKDITDLSAKKH